MSKKDNIIDYIILVTNMIIQLEHIDRKSKNLKDWFIKLCFLEEC